MLKVFRAVSLVSFDCTGNLSTIIGSLPCNITYGAGSGVIFFRIRNSRITFCTFIYCRPVFLWECTRLHLLEIGGFTPAWSDWIGWPMKPINQLVGVDYISAYLLCLIT